MIRKKIRAELAASWPRPQMSTGHPNMAPARDC